MFITSCNKEGNTTEYQTETTTTTMTSTTTTITTTIITTTVTTEFQYHNMLENYNPESIPDDLKEVSWTEDIVFTDTTELENYLTEMVNSYICKIPVIIPTVFKISIMIFSQMVISV